MSKRILICGSRDWTNELPIRRVLRGLQSATIIHGGARGADAIAGAVARKLNLTVQVFPADWKSHGKAAGPIRNRLMLEEGRPSEVWAFKNDFERSLRRGGTENMVKIAREAGIPTFVVSEW